MGKDTDKLYITHNEQKTKRLEALAKVHVSEKVLPFWCCALSRRPFVTPLCTPDGIVYDSDSIIPWITKHHVDPVTGRKLNLKDLLKLNFEKNSDGKYICPISKKEFNINKPILAISTTGNVYSSDTVETINIKPKFWRDLLTDEPFKRTDIIKIYDPRNLALRTKSNFYYVKKSIPLDFLTTKNNQKDEKTLLINENSTITRTLRELEKKISENKLITLNNKEKNGQKHKSAREASKKDASIDNEETVNYYAVSTSAAFTSNSLDPIVKGVLVKKVDEEYIFRNVKGSAYVQISTNLGNLNFELHCEAAPKTCYNFIKLCNSKYYHNTKFHRLITKFMIQGGDPTGTGKGGESYWKKTFNDEFSKKYTHSYRGVLSMANRGPNTNTSQFFITFRPCEHLDNKHTVFGLLVGGSSVLDLMEATPADRNDSPKSDIIIISTKVFVDPFEKLINGGKSKPSIIDPSLNAKRKYPSFLSNDIPDDSRKPQSNNATQRKSLKITKTHSQFGNFDSW